jgi:hypothetical protein
MAPVDRSTTLFIFDGNCTLLDYRHLHEVVDTLFLRISGV